MEKWGGGRVVYSNCGKSKYDTWSVDNLLLMTKYTTMLSRMSRLPEGGAYVPLIILMNGLLVRGILTCISSYSPVGVNIDVCVLILFCIYV